MTQTISNKQLIQTTLETKQTELQEHITRLELVIPAIITATERQVQETILANERVVLAQVETALHRLEGGTYGYCIDCARAIPEARLKAKPWAIRCVEDEERSEEKEREVKTIVVLKPFLTHLSKDLQYMASTSTQDEVRNLVNAYYSKQKDRIGWGNQIRALETQGQPHLLLNWLFENALSAEKEIQKALDAYSRNQVIGQWLRSVPGIGPVIASGLLAHIDIEKAPYAGNLLSFSGAVPTVVWEKGQKRPWNADLKKLALYLAGESFVKTQNNPRDVYGHIFAKRKEIEIQCNELGMFREQAQQALQAKKYRQDTKARECYEKGMLPPAHIHARARRFAVKIFLTHVHAVMYEHHYGKEAPKPYVIEYLNHHSYLKPPFWPLSDNPTVEHQEEIIDLSIFSEPGPEELEEEYVTEEPQHLTLAAKLAHFKRSVERHKENGANGV